MKLDRSIAIRNAVHHDNRTLLGIHSLSKNIAAATITVSREIQHPLFLVANRRQIDRSEFGVGDTDCGNTEEFAAFVRRLDPEKRVILARGQGGPWQNPVEIEKNLSVADAMASAKRSLQTDIESGFEMIHIDPSLTPPTPGANKPTTDEILARCFELYGFCWELARSRNQELLFEIGTGEQSEGYQDLTELEYTLRKTTEFCNRSHLPLPSFFVAQVATKVSGARNLGRILKGSSAHRQKELRNLTQLCNRYGVWLRASHVDFLPKKILADLTAAGVQAANVAPELGITETLALLQILRHHRCPEEREAFIDLAYRSEHWKNGLSPNSTANRESKAVLAGHSVFGTSEFQLIKEKAVKSLQNRKVQLDVTLQLEIKKAILRYLVAFNLKEKIKVAPETSTLKIAA